MTSKADLFFFGGNIITMDENNPSAEALAVKGDIIQAVGKFDKVFALTGPTTEFIYLNHQTLLPGFIEPHQHAVTMVINRAVGTIELQYGNINPVEKCVAFLRFLVAQ